MANSRCSAVAAEMASDVVISSVVKVTSAVIVDASARAEPGESAGSDVVIVTQQVVVVMGRESSAARLLTGRQPGGQRGPAAERAELDAGGHADYSRPIVPPSRLSGRLLYSAVQYSTPARSPTIRRLLFRWFVFPSEL